MNPSDCGDESPVDVVQARRRKYIVLIIYDIVDNKTRYKMVKCLENYGLRVQKSAFEAFLTKEKCEKMAQEASQIIDISTDSLRIYVLLDRMSVRSWGVGDCHTEEVIIC